MLCPFRKRKVEYESQIGYGEKGDIIATFTEELYMECDKRCAYAHVEKPYNYDEEEPLVYVRPEIKCRRIK